MRIEDTNPENIHKPAYKLIEKEGKWLCDNQVEFIIQSERMDKYYQTAEELIKKDSAYVCDCDNEEFKELLLKKKACPCRDLDKKEHSIIIIIEDKVLVGPNAVMRASGHRYEKSDVPIRSQGHSKGKIIIKAGAWIGANAVILPDVTIGKGAVVAAGAVVTKDVPPYSLVAGVPARVIRDLKACEPKAV